MCLIWFLTMLYIVHHTHTYQCICNDSVAYRIHAKPEPYADIVGVSFYGNCFFYNGTEVHNNETFWKTYIKGKPGWFWYKGYVEPHIGNCSDPIRDVKEGANCLYLMLPVELYSHPYISKENHIIRLQSCRHAEDCPRLISNEEFYINNNSWYNVTYKNTLHGYVVADDPIRWHCHYDTESSNIPVWEISIIALSVLVLLLVVLFAGYKHKRKRSKLKWITPNTEQTQVSGKQTGTKFDVFISYCHEDLKWVKTLLYKNLQDEGYTICIDFKDFVPGVDEAENIINAINNSKKIVVVMSVNFQHSMWGQFELKQAHIKTIAQRKDIMILIKIGNCTIPPQLMGKTFLDWTNKKEETYFWKRLFKSIGKPTNQS